MSASGSNSFVAGVLQRTGLFSEQQLNTLLEVIRASDLSATTITNLVVQREWVQESVFLDAMAKVLGLPFLRLDSEATSAIPKEALDKLPAKVVFDDKVMPVSFQNGVLLVVTSDPLNADLAEKLRFAADASVRRIRLGLSPASEIVKAARKRYGVGAETVDRMEESGRFDAVVDEDVHKQDLSELGQEASIVNFVYQIIAEADAQGATDIHFEPMEDQLRVRYRVDGRLHDADVPAQLRMSDSPAQLRVLQAAITSRIKVMASMDIAEKRKPMDGRIGLRIRGDDLDIRVSTMPTVYGESVSLRLLQKKGSFVGLKDLGMSERDCGVIQKIIQRPNGIVLVTGPTGSGKSTTLYAYLHEINSPDVRILTAEEPIEYEMKGINQVLVRPEIELSFDKLLRHFLRQDPDIIMVGEVRDGETAKIAIRAALTGHLVFSTLHTNDAASAFARLIDMGAEPYLVASAVEAVVAQRLVRRLCPACRVPDPRDRQALKEMGFPVENLSEAGIYNGGKCERCRMTGFQGRSGIFEILDVTEPIESMIIARIPTNEIKQKAIEANGMLTLRDDGWLKVLEGVTSVEEVLWVTEEQ
jgi:type II secretory ATPase GspE/PulE/Tfp pilus assembly ATPase PilB-like protein